MPKKSLSQNFLIDLNMLAKIVEQAEIQEGETVLEIGSGPGGLTKALLAKKCKVIAVEKDLRFASLLTEIFPGENLTVVHQDFLTYTISERVKVVANIPYHITAPLLQRLAQFAHHCSKIVLVTQKDWATRLAIPPPSKSATFLSYYLHFHFLFSKGFTISASCFWPLPKVSSMLLSLTPKKELPELDRAAFFSFIASFFQRKRKMMRSLFKDLPFEELGLSKTARPEELSLEQFLALYRSFAEFPPILP